MLSNAVVAILAGLSAVSARGLPNLHRPYVSASVARGTGTGSVAFVTVDNAAVHVALADAHKPATGGNYSACLANTTASVSDCRAVIGDIAGNNNGTLKVAPGFCLNWWEGACLGRVCGAKNLLQGYEADAKAVADTVAASILDTCVAAGQSGAAGDCADVTSTCGTYRYELLTFEGF
ncbi:hypothetical protein F4804DRAFT_296940 [Jackrogersella minutella]|nr:hypothetical protein F4804DRAFT_296940 [Jackrogersella minutella]